jgi:hypothetical protein
LPNRACLLQELHAWTVLVGSAAIAALLASFLDGAPPREARYGYETVDGMRCLVEDGSDTFVDRADGTPECVQRTFRSPARIAQR